MAPRLQSSRETSRRGLLECNSGAVALLVTAALLLTGCARDITGIAVTVADPGPVSPSGGDGHCATVTAPLADLPPQGRR